MRLEWIEDILAVIDTGSLSLAARKRFLTQSAFSRRVHAIEEALGTTLFDRGTRPVRPMAHVAELEGEMRGIARRLHALRTSLADPAAVTAMSVSFACQHTIATTISPGLIRDWTRDGRMNVRVRSSDRDACLMMLLTSEVDFALIFEPLAGSREQERRVFLEESLGSDWMIPVIASQFAEELNASIGQWILPVIAYPKELYLGQLLEREFLSNIAPRYQVRRVVETELALAALHYTLEGIGVGWLPRSLAERDIERGTLLDISDRLPGKELHIRIVRLRNEISVLAERIWERVKAEYHGASATSTTSD